MGSPVNNDWSNADHALRTWQSDERPVLKGRSSKTTQIRNLMSSPPITITPDASISECMRVMTRNHIRHLPVMEGEAVMGVVSIGDVVNTIISEQENTIQDLESYITVGGGPSGPLFSSRLRSPT